MSAIEKPRICYTSAELAAMLGIKPTTLTNWRVAGRGPKYIRLGAKRSPVIYLIDDVDAWLAAQKRY